MVLREPLRSKQVMLDMTFVDYFVMWLEMALCPSFLGCHESMALIPWQVMLAPTDGNAVLF